MERKSEEERIKRDNGIKKANRESLKENELRE